MRSDWVIGRGIPVVVSKTTLLGITVFGPVLLIGGGGRKLVLWNPKVEWLT